MNKTTLTSTAKFVASAAHDNPNLGWLEFILTDDKPNMNNQGIKATEFASLISTGLFMPLKMAEGAINPDHSNALPLGTIIRLDDGTSQIKGEAALWKVERGEDYELLTSMSSAGDPLHISWEIFYSEAEVDAEGVEWIKEPLLAAATIVGVPAYGDRTPILSVASEEYSKEEAGLEDTWTKKYIASLPDTAFLYVTADERHFPYRNDQGEINCLRLEHFIQQLDDEEAQAAASKLYKQSCGGGNSSCSEETMELKELEDKVLAQEQELSELKINFASKEAELASKETELVSKEDELKELREYKESKEKAESEAALLKTRLELLANAGMTYSDEVVNEKKGVWLEMSEDAFSAMVEMLKDAKTNATSASSHVPDTFGESTEGIIEIVREGLKQMK